jgi:hypothetical protein
VLVATGAYPINARDTGVAPLALEFHYDDSQRSHGELKVYRISGPVRFRLFVSGIDPAGCHYLKDGGALSALPNSELTLTQSPLGTTRTMQQIVYAVDVDESEPTDAVVCPISAGASSLSRETREMYFAHALVPRDTNWYNSNRLSKVDTFVFDDDEAQNVRGDNVATFSLTKPNPLYAVNDNEETNSSSIALNEATYARFIWTDGAAVGTKEAWFFLAGVLATILSTSVIEIWRAFAAKRAGPETAQR